MGRKPNDPAAPAPPAPLTGAGVNSLMRGQPPPAAEPAPKGGFPSWYLLAGDLLLVALALITIYKSRRPVPWPTELFCGATVALAAGLAAVAIFRREGR
jgi:hypothetical protein